MLLLSASFMFADTLHIFVPIQTSSLSGKSLVYEEVVYQNIKYITISNSRGDCYWSDNGVLCVSYNGRTYRYKCEWYSVPD